VTDPLENLTDIAWSQLRCAYGPADVVPELLGAIASGDPDRQVAALPELWANLCHQGTVYDCTSRAVPFIAALIARDHLRDAIRAELALLLASIASATSFVAGQPGRSFVVAQLRSPYDPAPDTELDETCRQALAAASDTLDLPLAAGPPATQAGLVAVAAAIAASLSPAARDAIARLSHADDACLASAAQLTMAIASADPVSDADLARHALVDEEAADYLAHITDWPVRSRAIQLVRELCERSIARRLA
jgi:hypothetical protein